MRVAIFDRVEPPVPVELPCRLIETCSHRGAVMMCLLAVPAALAIAFGAAMLMVQAAIVPEARAVLSQHPTLGIELLLAVAFFAWLLGMPLRRLFVRLTHTREVEINAAAVTVTEHGRFRSRTWSQPLGSYTGLAHHVRASLSGTRHELILVHPQREKSVLLSLAAKMAQTEVDRVATLISHKEIPASALYRFGVQLPRFVHETWRDAAHA
jgi:hypothetical protein